MLSPALAPTRLYCLPGLAGRRRRERMLQPGWELQLGSHHSRQPIVAVILVVEHLDRDISNHELLLSIYDEPQLSGLLPSTFTPGFAENFVGGLGQTNGWLRLFHPVMKARIMVLCSVTEVT